ncbi:MAG: hypothetical protein LQ338_004638 [Usnochroma carphineum]|nr:MAG: hypothetical protein LQ338_004638 [Usnochroma carphineum]
MDRPVKRRKIIRAPQISPKEATGNMGDTSWTQGPMLGDKDALDKQFLHAAISDIPKAVRKASPLISNQEKPKPQRLHPRNFVPYQAAETAGGPVVQPVEPVIQAVKPVLQPVTTAVASFVNVVLDHGGTSVGDVMVPAESTIFNLNGYGPITINKNPPPMATPSSQQRSSGPAPPLESLSDHSFVTSYTSTSKSVKFNVDCYRQRVVLWLNLIPGVELRPDFVCLKRCYYIADELRYHGNTGHSNLGSKFDYNLFVLQYFSDAIKFFDVEYHALQLKLYDHSSSASASGTSQGSGAVGGIGGPTGTAGAAPPSSTTAAAGSGGGNTAPTPTIVGSVVGSVAGLALILILLLFFLRRRKRLGQQRTISPPIPQSASTGPGANTGTMTERSSAAIPLAGAGAAFFRRLRPGSGATATTTETTPSERGFQNLGGRKLESVLSSRGDGFGDIPFGAASAGAAPGPSTSRGQAPPSIPTITTAPGAAPGHSSPESLDGSSFYRDSQGFYGGPEQHGQSVAEPPSNSSSMFVGPASPPQSPTHPTPGSSPEGVAVMRPGPARTPVTTQPGLSPMRGPPRQRGTPPPQIPGTIQERPRDGLGRSHPSLDGSRSSRFAENI